MDSYILSEVYEHQKLIGLVCLLLAAKSEDLDENVPSIKDLLRIVDMSGDLGVDLRFKDELDPKEVTNAYKSFALMYCKLEYLVFECLEFNTIRPTVVSFINIFQNLLVTEVDLTDLKVEPEDKNTNRQTLGDLRVNANDYLKQFSAIIIEDTDYFNILPSQLAAAIVGATRKLLKIKNYWNDKLEEITRCRVEDIRPMILILIEKHITNIYGNPDYSDDVAKGDSGYISPNSASETDDELKTVNKKRKLTRPGIIWEFF